MSEPSLSAVHVRIVLLGKKIFDKINLVCDSVVNTIDARQAAELLATQQKASGFNGFDTTYPKILDRNKLMLCQMAMQAGTVKDFWSPENQQLKQQAQEEWKTIAKKNSRPETLEKQKEK